MKHTQSTLKIVLLAGLFSFGFSCAKQPSGVRVVKQVTGLAMNQAVSQQSMNDASAMGVSYLLKSIERPEKMDNGTITVKTEVQTPDGQYLPLTSNHTTEKPQAYGILNLKSDEKLDVRAKCYGSECEKYIILVTVIKNNQSVYQIAAISNAHEDVFHYELLSTMRYQMFTSPDAVKQKYPHL